jgi:putative copper export protein
MLLPGVQTILGFQLMAVFNQRFENFSSGEQILHFAAFLLVALSMGLMLTPAAYHRHVERRIVSERFVKMSSRLLTWSMVPFLIGICLDTYLIGRIILNETFPALVAGIGMFLVLGGLWFVLPVAARPPAGHG